MTQRMRDWLEERFPLHRDRVVRESSRGISVDLNWRGGRWTVDFPQRLIDGGFGTVRVTGGLDWPGSYHPGPESSRGDSYDTQPEVVPSS